jgi:hypothetical protein
MDHAHATILRDLRHAPSLCNIYTQSSTWSLTAAVDELRLRLGGSTVTHSDGSDHRQQHSTGDQIDRTGPELLVTTRTSGNAGGAGLGLAISRRIARTAGGDVRVAAASSAAAGGAFVVRLPLA